MAQKRLKEQDADERFVQVIVGLHKLSQWAREAGITERDLIIEEARRQRKLLAKEKRKAVKNSPMSVVDVFFDSEVVSAGCATMRGYPSAARSLLVIAATGLVRGGVSQQVMTEVRSVLATRLAHRAHVATKVFQIWWKVTLLSSLTRHLSRFNLFWDR